MIAEFDIMKTNMRKNSPNPYGLNPLILALRRKMNIVRERRNTPANDREIWMKLDMGRERHNLLYRGIEREKFE